MTLLYIDKSTFFHLMAYHGHTPIVELTGTHANEAVVIIGAETKGVELKVTSHILVADACVCI